MTSYVCIESWCIQSAFSKGWSTHPKDSHHFSGPPKRKTKLQQTAQGHVGQINVYKTRQQVHSFKKHDISGGNVFLSLET